MDLIKSLRKLNKIQPDQEYSRKSRLVVLNTQQLPPTPSAFRLLAISSARFTTALAIVAIFILVVVGGFSINKTGDEIISGLDLRGLRAEAQAIDIQIELTRVVYEEGEETEKAIVVAKKISPSTKGGDSATLDAEEILKAIDESTSTEVTTIDAILEKISN
ncbi:MAG: hypothetical protein AAB594_03425 [Patescibacteria group bacterium]